MARYKQGFGVPSTYTLIGKYANTRLVVTPRGEYRWLEKNFGHYDIKRSGGPEVARAWERWSGREVAGSDIRENPSASAVPTHEVSGFVRRLPSGQIQVKIPLSSLRRKKANPRRRRNIAGFMDSEGQFHPIRAGTRLKTKGKRTVKVADKRAYSRKKAGERVRAKTKTRRKKTNPRVRKTRDVWELWANYGYGDGWEHEITEDTYREARQRLKEYRENAPQYSYRLKHRRERL